MRYILLVALALFLAACAAQGPVCSTPYILHEGSCCLDKDADGACDPAPAADEAAPLSCDLCPPKFVTQTEEVPVYKYVCINGTIVDDANECGHNIVSDAHEFTVNREQDDDKILTFDARPACRGKYRAAEIHVRAAKAPRLITFQVMDDPQGSFENAFELNGTSEVLDDKYVYVGFCEDCEGLADLDLLPDGAYLIRARLTYAGETVTTRDLLLDPTPEGDYGQQRC